MRGIICLAGIGVVALLIASLWFDEGEVVTLVTVDAKGNHHETHLWIVDLEGDSFLRAESPSLSWLSEIQQFPDVQLDRGDRRTDYRAIPVDAKAVREAVSRAMAEKYGALDQVSQWFWDHSRSIPVKLQTSSAKYAAPQGRHSVGVSP